MVRELAKATTGISVVYENISEMASPCLRASGSRIQDVPLN